MKKLVTYIVGFVLVGLAFLSCKTDFDINAPYKPIPIIYGLLDQSKDTQFVKINKSFIGDGNNVDYASINDSLLFSNVSARVEQYAPGLSSPFKVYDLQELWVGNLQSGIFYEDSQKVYYFVPDAPLNDEHLYQLVVSVDDVQEDITAQTRLLDGSSLSFDYLFSLSLGINGLNFADVNLGTSDVFYSPQIKWNTAPRGKRYELTMSFRYNEITSNSSIPKTIYWSLGTQTAIGNGDALNDSEKMFVNLSGEQFFEMVNSRLMDYPNEAQVLKREIVAVDFIVSAGNEDLNTYIEVNEPATGVVTERPTFTNISGDGIGLFASKCEVAITGNFSDGSILELCKGSLTSQYKFCIDSTDQITAISNLTGGVNVGCN
ncbi:MAG: hypothetical protein VX756_01195 [Bacteroidota bacterium]|nr:hypothetical protein [Bacteroidota bacterium]